MMTNLQSSAFVARTTQLLSSVARLRLLLVMLLTLTVSANAWADYTITFKTSGSNTDGSSAQTTISTLISSGDANVSSISASRAYNGKDGYGVKLGSSSAVGNVSMTLATDAQIKASKLVVKAACYDSGKTLKVTVTYTDNTTTTQTITPASSPTDYDVSLTDTKTIKQIKIESVTASKGRMYCHSIKVVAASAAVTTYTVTYDLNGGTGTTPTQANVAAGGTFTLAASSGFSKAGYSFAGWNDGTTTYNASATYTMPAKAVTLKAQWTALPKYTVNWYVNGSRKHFQTDVVGTALTDIPVPTTLDCDGEREFVGWTTQSSYEHATNAPTDLITSTSSMTMPENGANYYAVFAIKETSGSGTAGWNEVTSTSDLEAGATYAISNAATKGTYLSTWDGGNNFDGSTTTICKLVLGGTSDAWTFQINDESQYNNRYLTATNTTSSNYLKAVESADKYSYFTISFTNGAAVITCTGKASRNILRYNANSGSPIFACYSSGQSAVYLQKYSTGTTITYSDYTTSCITETAVYLIPKNSDF